VEKGRTKSSVGWDRDGTRTDSELEFSVSSAPSSGGDFYQLEAEINGARGGHLLNSFLGLIDSFSNFHHDRPNHVSQWSQWTRPSGGIFGNKRPNEGTNRPNGVNILPNPPSNRPNNANNLQVCSPSNPCGKGYGDCETDQDCLRGLFCGKNNCKGEFGSHSPEGILWERKDDCCTDDSNYCNLADVFPSSRRSCCSPSKPCAFSHGDCDKDSDCRAGLVCGDNNCKDFHNEAGDKDDCCTYAENGGSSSNGVHGPNGGSSSNNSNGVNGPNGGNQPCSPTNQCGKGVGDCETDKDCHEGLFCGKNNCKGEFGGRSPEGSLWDEKDDCCTDNKDYCNQADLFPWWRTTCCTPETPCRFSHGDCDKDEECAQNLVCGDNNCKDFHVEAGQKDDCCTYPEYRSKRSRETEKFSGDQVIQLSKHDE